MCNQTSFGAMADEPKHRPAFAAAAWTLSISAHAIAVVALLRQPFIVRPEPMPSAVRIEVVKPPPPAARAPDPPKPEPERPKPVVEKPAPAPRAEASPSVEPEPERPPPEPSGVTLDAPNGEGAKFEVPAGDG